MTATTTEDELLIITDDSITPEIELNISEEKVEVEENIISFGDETSAVESPEEITLDIKEESMIDLPATDKESNLDLNFDLGGGTVEDMFALTEEKTELPEEKIEPSGNELNLDLGGKETIEEPVTIPAVDDTEASNLDFGSLETNTQEEITKVPEENNIEDFSLDMGDLDVELESSEETQMGGTSGGSTQSDDSTTGDDDVNSILDVTIAKLVARKAQIEGVKADTMNQISELKIQIKSLQSDVRSHNNDVKKLDTETTKITENVVGLKKMKMKK